MNRAEHQEFNDSVYADKWAGAHCTLDGKPATVLGRLNRFGMVASVAHDGPAWEFSWSTINRVMTRDGKFKS